jgi:membrane associated rhomboid family serine protease
LFPLKDNIPTDKFPVVTVALIVINVLAYFLWQRGGITLGDPSSPHYFDNLVRYSEFPYEVTHPGQQCIPVNEQTFECAKSYGAQYNLPPTYLTVFTAMFMHGGLLHLGGNMLFLWIFGNNVEDSMGHVRFVVFYLLGGLAALGLQILIGPNSTVPTLGASGAIAAVLGGYILIYPRARVLTLIFLFVFFTFIEIPAFFFLFIWFAQQAIFGAIDLTDPTGGSGGVAYFAHVGGFAFGLAAIKLFAQRRSSAYGQPKYPVY